MQRLVLVLAVLGLAACNSGTPDESSGAPADNAATPEPVEAGTDIPGTLQGRWGLVPGDCEAARGDTQGLLTIGPDSLQYYESVAGLGEIKERSSSRIRADFAFTGEGDSWNREMELDSPDGGSTMVVREFGEGALPIPLGYDRCL